MDGFSHSSLDCCNFSNTSANMLRGAYKILTEDFDIDFKAVVCLILAGISIVIYSGFQLYLKIRPKFPIKVNCWFCNTDSKTHFFNRNSWTCPKCDQYNGFTPSGDYNKIIPEHSSELLNHSAHSVKWEPYSPNHNGLCMKCNINQELKVQQLASFVPLSKANFDEEIEMYRQRLERAYRLCYSCENKLCAKLDSINGWIQKLYPAKKIDLPIAKKNFNWLVYSLRFMSLLLATLALLTVSVQLNIVVNFMNTLSKLQMLIKWSLSLEVANFAVVLLSSAITKPPISSGDLMLSLLWFFAATINFVSTNPLLKIYKSQATFFHIMLSVISCASTYMVHLCALRNKSDTENKTRGVKIAVLDEELKNLQDQLKTTSSSPASNGTNIPKSATPVTPEEKRSLTPCKESANVPESPMKPVQSSLNLLSLGPLSAPKSTSSVFEPKVYSPSSIVFNNLDGCEVRRRKPIVHPPKFNPWTNSYWGSVPVPLSRSSSQSSGFASQNGTNYSSLPNSRSGSVCGDVDRFSVLSEPIYPSLKTYNQPFYVPCMPQFYLPPVQNVQPAPYMPPLSPNSSQSTIDSNLNESVLSNSSAVSDKSVFSLMRENFGLATVFLCSIVFNAVVIALAVANTLSTAAH